MEPWVATIIAAGIAAVAGIGGVVSGAILTNWLQARNRRNQFVQEGAIARYAEFVGIASAEEMRAELLIIHARSASSADDKKKLFEIDSQRHQHRRDLQRLAWQIQLLEANQQLRGLLQRLVDEMPYEVVLLTSEDRTHPTYMAADTRFTAAWQNYKQMLTQLVNLVQEVHLGARPVTAPSPPTTGTNH